MTRLSVESNGLLPWWECGFQRMSFLGTEEESERVIRDRGPSEPGDERLDSQTKGNRSRTLPSVD